MRPIWNGSISFGRVSALVRMDSATGSKQLRFHVLHKDDLQSSRESVAEIKRGRKRTKTARKAS